VFERWLVTCEGAAHARCRLLQTRRAECDVMDARFGASATPAFSAAMSCTICTAFTEPSNWPAAGAKRGLPSDFALLSDV